MLTRRPMLATAAMTLAVLLPACNAGTVGRGAPEDARSFFKGKTMIYIVATEAGGGYDLYGRLVGRFLGKHLGLANVVVKNVSGGGHIRGANAIATARPDGLTLGIFNSGLIYAQLVGREGLQFDLKELSWIGKAGVEPRVLVTSSPSGLRSLDDLRRLPRPLLLGANGAGNESYYDTLLVMHTLGLRVRFVFGLASRDTQLSMMRNEIDGAVGSASSMMPFVKNGYGNVVLRVGSGDGVDEEVPDAAEIITSEEGKALIRVVESIGTLLRWTAGPPGLPADRLELLREAYMAALQDPALVAEAQKLQIPIAPMDGASLTAAIDRVLTQPPDTLALIRSVATAKPVD